MQAADSLYIIHTYIPWMPTTYYIYIVRPTYYIVYTHCGYLAINEQHASEASIASVIDMLLYCTYYIMQRTLVFSVSLKKEFYSLSLKFNYITDSHKCADILRDYERKQYLGKPFYSIFTPLMPNNPYIRVFNILQFFLSIIKVDTCIVNIVPMNHRKDIDRLAGTDK